MGLELPVDMPLQVLDLRNVTLSWPSQSHLFNGLRELHLDFKDCDPIVFIPEDELFGILDASPRLEHLSLVWVGHEVPEKNGQPLPPKRILQLPNLASLVLDNDPIVIKYTLAYMGLPVITSLSIHTFFSLDIARTLKNRLFPEEGLPARLFLNPPIFTFSIGELDDTVEIDIGSIHLQFGFPRAQSENGREAVMTFIPSLVPASVTTLELECTQLTERGWRDFFMLHPEVRSIECAEFRQLPVFKSLWDALSSAGEDTDILPCPKLESISITSYAGGIALTSLLDCLRNRQAAGFKLRHFKVADYHLLMDDMDGRFHEEFDPLVEVVETDEPDRQLQRVSPIFGLEVGMD